MTKPRTESNLSDLLDQNLTFRIRELSDLKSAIRAADQSNRFVLLKALIALTYAHWEGFVKFGAEKYFEFVALRKYRFTDLQPIFYSSSYLARLGSFANNKPNISDRLELLGKILNNRNERFSYINAELINTGSNLNFEVFRNICTICDIKIHPFEGSASFIDVILLKRRNAIAHGQDALIDVAEMDEIVDGATTLMRSFKNELENKVYSRNYLI
jgi:hypothetical protein